MLQVFDEKTALDISRRYFNLLSQTGYVRHDSVLRFLMYTFLLDFVDYTHMFFSEEDYNQVDKALRLLFAGGGCLMPYPVFCTNSATLGRNEYMGKVKIRKTENDAVDKDGNDISYSDRYTQDDQPRTV